MQNKEGASIPVTIIMIIRSQNVKERIKNKKIKPKLNPLSPTINHINGAVILLFFIVMIGVISAINIYIHIIQTTYMMATAVNCQLKRLRLIPSYTRNTREYLIKYVINVEKLYADRIFYEYNTRAFQCFRACKL